MRLHQSIHAPHARRVRIFLAETGLASPFVDVDLAKNEHRTEAFGALNPFRLVPALELDDGGVIAESIAICRYFEEMQPDPPLFGVTPRERAEVEMWQRLAEFQLLFTIAQVFRHTHPAMREMESPQVADWAESNRAKATTALRRFDAALAARRYLAGDTFTVADITAMVALDFTRPARLVIPDGLTNLARWRAEVTARPSAKA